LVLDNYDLLIVLSVSKDRIHSLKIMVIYIKRLFYHYLLQEMCPIEKGCYKKQFVKLIHILKWYYMVVNFNVGKCSNI